MMAKRKNLTSNQVGLLYGFRSGLEERVAKQLKDNGIDPKFETIKLPYREEKNHTYTPDFPVGKRIIIETKGRFLTADRMKMLMVQKQHPEYEFRFIFSNSNARISKVSQTTYGRWCEKNGFKYADKVVPQEWIEEIKGELNV
jgi:hypothetical protein